MRKANWPFYLYSLCAILLFACQDDNDPEITPSGNEDTFVGAQHVITLRDETEDFRYSGFTCTMSTEDGTIITRKGEHIRMEGKSILTLDTGLKKGIYRFLYLTTPIVAEAGADTTWLEYGLGGNLGGRYGKSTRPIQQGHEIVRERDRRGSFYHIQFRSPETNPERSKRPDEKQSPTAPDPFLANRGYRHGQGILG